MTGPTRSAGFLVPWASSSWLPGLLLVLGTVLAYRPAWNGGFLWDDDIHVTNNRMLVEAGGLKQIWTSPDSPQYYPMVFTSFRLERGLWGLNPTGYHWVNLLLHATSAVLVWRVLRLLSVPGAWLAAAMFALHPVNVESVAWISQRKNILAMFFYLLSLLWYLWSDPEPRFSPLAPRPSGSPQPSTLNPQPLWYWLSLAAFVLALLSKTAVSPFPLVLLVLAWWRRGCVARRDVWRSIPFFIASLVLSLITVWFERHQTSIELVRDDGWWSRLAGAGWAVLFYLYKAVLPLNLMPIYPRWHIDAAKAWSYAPGLLLVGALLLCWGYRRSWGKACLAALGYSVVMLLPVLGFVNIGFMRYSLVADHWQYFAILGPIALAAAGLATALGRIERPPLAQTPPPQAGALKSASPPSAASGSGSSFFSAICCGALLLALGGLTWRQCAFYADSETFWRTVVATNPGCWRAHSDLGELLSAQGRLDEAIAQYQQCLELQPDFVYAHNNLGNALRQQGRTQEALLQYRKALELQPDFAWADCNLGMIYLQQGRVEEAITEFQQALRTGVTQFKKPMFAPGAVAQIQYLLGCALARKDRMDEAIPHYREALALQPDLAEAHFQLAVALVARHQVEEASRHYREAVRLKPDWLEALNNLAWLLATQPDERLRDGKLAVELASRGVALSHTNNATLLDTLAAALAEAGRFPEAADADRTAARLAQTSGAAQLGREIQAHLQCFERSQPVRGPSGQEGK